ncbi:PLP-dependent aminotransferase family protein [Microbacterium sp. MYb62]|uniref:MocR-like pyridoxine biosynthesis transcription factor PdxR n=1 Tax=Microbacterium sp. MYb62 TaxID=1848690 RepID=UPI000CFD8CC6|nr:PLP-dependent aminotransferase family protein [Microbacterium sp. MYb62]PRB13660.1 GntR family transcriptional regulator [Microbacterium sp. MYb62]
MQKTRPILAWETLLDLEAEGTEARPPLRDRVESALRRAIDEGRLAAGSAVPPSRTLAETLGVSRWVVTEAYGQLVAEGVLDARIGSATRVAERQELPEPTRDIDRPRPRDPAPVSAPPIRYDLRPGIPDLRSTPRSRWAAALRAGLADLPDRELAAAHPFGYAPARAAVAAYLSRSRHADADPDRVTITHGATDGMDILTRELHGRGHRTILVEDPSWPRLRGVAENNGLRPIRVPVDDDGVDTEMLAAVAARTGARAALVTPAHQFPLGAALAPARREQLVRWAREHAGLVIEDDYDAEFRYDRRPVPALQRLAPDCVALIGSLSKSVSPALGLGWMLLPPGIAPAPSPSAPSLIDQAALAHFVTQGDFERHLRASRTRFRRRRQRLLDALTTELPDSSVAGIAAGMHLVLTLPSHAPASAVVDAGAAEGLALTALRRYTDAADRPDALVLGYGDLDDALVEEAVARLAALLR